MISTDFSSNFLVVVWVSTFPIFFYKSTTWFSTSQKKKKKVSIKQYLIIVLLSLREYIIKPIVLECCRSIYCKNWMLPERSTDSLGAIFRRRPCWWPTFRIQSSSCSWTKFANTRENSIQRRSIHRSIKVTRRI